MTPDLLTTDPIPRLSLAEWALAGAQPLGSTTTPVNFIPGSRLVLGDHQSLTGVTLQLPSLFSVFGQGTWGGTAGYRWGGGWVSVEGNNWLIEDCTFEAINPPRYSHNVVAGESGFNAIHITNNASQGIIRRCTFKNLDSAVFFRGGSHHITMEDCVIDSTRLSWQSDPHFQTGHYGVHLGSGCHHNLVSRVRVNCRLMHDISVQDEAHWNVVEDCSGQDLNLDHHRQNPHHNLFTACDHGAGTRPFTSSGNTSSGPNNGDWECFWGNYKADGSPITALPNFATGYWTKKLSIIGHATDKRTATAEWYEAIAKDSLTPRNLYRYLVGAPLPPPPLPTPP